MPEKIKLQYIDNPKLLSQIKRSYGQCWKSLRLHGEWLTKKFVFKRVDQNDYDYKRIMVRFIKVEVIETEEVFIVMQGISYGKEEWNLYKIKEGKT